MKNKLSILIISLIVLLGVFMPINTNGKEYSNSISFINPSIKVIRVAHSLFSPPEVLAAADYTCDGTTDNIEVQAAVNALPAVGGRVEIYTGSYVFGATVSRAINNVTIVGMGEGTSFTYNESSAIFSAGSQSGWNFAYFKTDAGWITLASATSYSIVNCSNNGTLASYISGLTFLGNNITTTGSFDGVDISTHTHGGAYQGGTVDHINLSNKGTNTHSQIDTFIGSKGASSGLASLSAGTLVVENPANATATPDAAKIPISDGDTFLAQGWLGSGSPDGTKYLRDDQTWQTPTAASTPIEYTKRVMSVLKNQGAATASTVGLLAAPTLTATAASADDTDGPLLRHATTNVSGNPSGVISAAFTILRTDWNVEYITNIKTDPNDINNQRYWIGIFSTSPDAVARSGNIHLASFSYDTGLDGTAFWRTCTSSGAGSWTTNATTQSIAANTLYQMRIVSNTAGTSIAFYINNVLVNTHTTTLPTSTQLLGYGNRLTTLTTTIKYIKWGRIYILEE